jgi:hypothetical protein
MDYHLSKLAKKTPELPDKLSESAANDKHMNMLEAIRPYARVAEQKNLTPVYVDYKTRNTKMVLVLCPEWAPEFPPFNLARLSGIAKSAGYETHIIDVNIRAFNKYENDWRPNRKIPFRLYDSSASWHWRGDAYWNNLHHIVEPLLEEAVQEIIELNPQIVGFTVYYISEEPTKWMAKRIKELRPDIKIAIGGSNVHQSWANVEPFYDYVVSGEGEQAILDILEEIENGVEHSEPQLYRQPVEQRININNMPMPDYESIDFSQYRIPNGVNTEISRGCTAKCTFCEETHFWKYRQRQSVDLIKEVEWLYYNKGVNVFWFIDSLVNGNVNELRAFAKAVAAKELDIHWTGYARCDGRMDLEYFKDLKAGGCIMLNYGIESGSQRVLNDMAKGVTVEEMEANFRDGTAVGIYASTNWIVGFPTEDYKDFADSMTFLWRNRNMNINNVGAGVGFSLGPETIVGQNPDKYNLSAQKYQNHWITKDFRKGGTHVMTRVKTFHIYLDLISSCSVSKFSYPKRDNLPIEHYKIKLHDEKNHKEIEYEDFDYNIIKPDINPFADSLVNEIWPFLRMLWRTRGGFDAEIYFNPAIDLKEFGSQFGPGMYTADLKFSINSAGSWSADFKYEFDQNVENPWDDRNDDRKGPFYANDYSRMMSNTAKRARRLAKPNWNIETGRDDMEFWDIIVEEKKLNKTIDFSFKYHYQHNSKW